ncbi:MAG: FMN-binding protein [Clostridia bacterium]
MSRKNNKPSKEINIPTDPNLSALPSISEKKDNPDFKKIIENEPTTTPLSVENSPSEKADKIKLKAEKKLAKAKLKLDEKQAKENTDNKTKTDNEKDTSKETSDIETPNKEKDNSKETSDIETNIDNKKSKKIDLKKEDKTSLSESDKPTEKTFFMQIVDLSLRLFVITTVVVLLLAVVNYFTAPVIKENSEKAQSIIMQADFENATFKDITTSIDKTANPLVVSVNEATIDGKLAGYCLKVVPKGYGGEINMLCSVSLDKAVVGVSVISAAETPGIGTKVITAENLSNYKGYKLGDATDISNTKEGEIVSGATSEAKIVSGATITSTAIYKGIKSALLAVNSIIAS